jgi:hypothetical protein
MTCDDGLKSYANLRWVWEGEGALKRSGDLVIGKSGDRKTKTGEPIETMIGKIKSRSCWL